MSDDIQKKIREELASLQKSKVATRTDKQLQYYDAWNNDSDLQERRKKAQQDATKGIARPEVSEKLKVFYKDPNNAAWIKEKNQAMMETEEWKAAHREGLDRLKDDPEHQKMVKERNKKTAESSAWKEAQRKGAIKKYEEDPEYNKKRIKSLRKTKGKECHTPYGIFSCAAEFNEQGLTKCNFADNMKIKPHLFYYTENGPGEPLYETVLYSPYGCLPKLDTNIGGTKRLYQLALDAKDEFAMKYKDYGAWFRRVKRDWPDEYYEKQEIKREWALETNKKLGDL
jgi:hypothetical protein